MQLAQLPSASSGSPDADDDDIGNCTNRSPYPTLHLLREDSIDRAVAAFPEAEAIFGANIDNAAHDWAPPAGRRWTWGGPHERTPNPCCARASRPSC